MTEAAVAHSSLLDAEAGRDLARQVQEQLPGAEPDAVIVFASPRNDFQLLIEALLENCRPKHMVGCSSAGEFTSDAAGTGTTSLLALRSSDLVFTASLASNVAQDRAVAAQKLAAAFAGTTATPFRNRTALILIDALAGYVEDFIDHLTVATAGRYRFVGGGAGDDAQFATTHVFCGRRICSNAAVALEILSNKPIGIGARHGWQPSSRALRATESTASRLISLNVTPAADVFADHAASTNQQLLPDRPMPFFLHNVLGLRTEAGHKLRVPLGFDDGGTVLCAAEVPTGSIAHIMCTTDASAAEAASEAVRDAVAQVESEGYRPKVALFFDCVATRLRLGTAFETELAAVGAELGPARYVGFNTYGQIVRAEGQFSGFHNCTAVVCVLPE